MSKLVRKFDYNLNKSFYDAPFKAEPSTNRYEANKDLLYWLRFADGIRPQELSLAQNSANATYVGSVDNSESLIGNRNYSSLVLTANNYATFLDDSINFYDFNTVDAFTTSVWILPKQSPPFEDKILNFKYENTPSEFLPRISLKIKSTRRILINLTNISTDTFIPDNTGVGPLKLNEWNHVVFTYESSTTPDERIFNFYINGVQHGPYAVIRTLNVGIGHGPLTINCAPLNNNLIEVAELATWNRALTTDEAQAIYNATRGNSWVQASGFVSDSPRLELRDRDHATGSYPARSAHGMPDFNGRYGVQYFDNDAVDFTSNYAEGSIRFGSTPRLNTSLHLTGTYNQPEYKMRFQFTDYNQEPWKDLTTYYAIPLRTEGETTATTGSIVRRLKDAINDSSIGLQATLVGTNGINLRHHVPGAFVSDAVSFTNPSIRSSRLDVTASQFVPSDSELKVYPTMLPASSRWSDSGAIFPHEPSDIAAAGRSRRGIADAHVKFTPGQDLLPFVESRLDIDESRAFYSEGTPEDELPGFSARLSSKDSFVIDINPDVEHEVYFSTGSAAVTTHPGISYFNFADREWQALGEGWTNSNQSSRVDYISDDIKIATGSYLAFMPSSYWGLDNSGNRNMRAPANGGGSEETRDSSLNSIGKPTSFAGFPLASKFDPREGEAINLRNYINGPFLLEKVVVEVSGVLGAYPAFSGSFGSSLTITEKYSTGHGIQFFALIQKNNSVNKEIHNSVNYAYGTLTANIAIENYDTNFEQNSVRNVAFVSNVGTYPSDFGGVSIYDNPEDFVSTKLGKIYDSAYSISLSNDSTIAGNSSGPLPVTTSNFHTGSIKLEKSVSTQGVSSKSLVSSYTRFKTPVGGVNRNEKFAPIFGENLGGRDLFDISNGNSYIKSVSGAKIKKQIAQTGLNNINLNYYEDQSKISPVLLFPEDSLIIGVANQPIPSISNDSGELPDYVRNESNCATVFRTKLSPGIGKVTFYGSYLRDAQPLAPETSQPLTSNAVHEDVRDDSSPYGEARCMDQFLVEPSLSYSGSYLDTKLYDVYDSTLGIIAISQGDNHALALTLDGRVYSIGDNVKGQLGIGNYDTPKYEWQHVSFFKENGIQVKSIVAGSNCSFAIDTDGKGWAWGSNADYQLGLNVGILANNYSTPQPITRCEYRIRTVASPDPDLVSTLRTYTFVPIFKKISTRQGQVLAVISNPPSNLDSHIFTNIVIWGRNVGQFDFANLNNVADVPADRKCPIVALYFRPSRRILNGGGVIVDSGDYDYFSEPLASADEAKSFEDVSCGQNHGMCLTQIKSQNKLFTFGTNADGQLGIGNSSDTHYKRFNRTTNPLNSSLPAGYFISSIASSLNANFAIVSVTSGFATFSWEAYSWGLNSFGVLGDNNASFTHKHTSPTAINKDNLPAPATGITQRHFAEIFAGDNHAIAMLPAKNQYGTKTESFSVDRVYVWGENANYQLGLNNTTNQIKPIQAKTFANPELLIPNAASAGFHSSFIIRRDEGQYYAAGQGQLGVGTDLQKSGSNPVTTFTVSEFSTTTQRVYQQGSILAGQVPSSQGAVNRFVRIANDSETYYDSHVPRIQNVLNVANVQIKQTETADAEFLIDTAIFYTPPAEPDPAIHTENANWLFSFPFEPIFEGIQRSSNIEEINKSSDQNPTAIDAVIISGAFGLEYDETYLETLRYGGPFPDTPYITPLSFLVKPETLSKLFYGFGDFGGKLAIDPSTLKDGNSMPGGFGRTPGDFYYIREDADPERVVLPRGFKYGLINAVPLSRSAVFRADHYGQFRDMLEQGHDSAFFEKKRFKFRWSFGDVIQEFKQISSEGELLSPAVKLRFVSRADGLNVDPAETNSQNLSAFATSSLPYFDGNARERMDAQPDLLPDLIVFS